MSPHVISYELVQLTDRAFAPSRRRAGGDVLSASTRATTHLLRQLADRPPGSASLALRFVYNPTPTGAQRQQRLRIRVFGVAHQPEELPGISGSLGSSPLRYLHDLRPTKVPSVEWSSLQAMCEVVRRQTILPPTVTPDFNPHALEAYWIIDSLTPQIDNDYMTLDAGLSHFGEPIVVEVAATPVNVDRVLLQHTRYMTLLQPVGRSWAQDEEECVQNTHELGAWASVSRPLRRADMVADHVLHHQQMFHKSLTKPHLIFTIRVFAWTPQVARSVASLVGECAFEDGLYALVDWRRGDGHFEEASRAAQEFRVAPLPVLDILLGVRNNQILKSLGPLANMAPIDELSGVFRLPVAGQASPRCMRKNTDPPAVNEKDVILVGRDMQSFEANDTDSSQLVLALQNLPKHMFVSGQPGSGKSVFGTGLLAQLSQLQVPFVVFECGGKTECRRIKLLSEHRDPALRQMASSLRIYSPGNDSLSPLRYNPLWFPEGVSLHEHIENLRQCYKAAIAAVEPIPSLLGEGLEQAYEEHGRVGDPPRMSDVVSSFENVLALKDYVEETNSDLRAAGGVRLGTLTRRGIGKVFQCRRNAPTIDDLVRGQSIIELSSLPGDQACLLVLFMLTTLWEWAKSTPWSGQGVRLVILIEEAHNILGRDTSATASEDNANPKAHASAMVCRMLAELRALGVAIVILDQLPSAVAGEVIKNTATKIAFRQVDSEDRQIIGASMLFGAFEDEQIARLLPGHAFYFPEGYALSRLVKTVNVEESWPLPPPPSCQELRQRLVQEDWFIQTAGIRVAEELALLQVEMTKLEDRCRQMLGQAADLVGKRPVILSKSTTAGREQRLDDLAGRAARLSQKLGHVIGTFERDAYRPLLGQEPLPGTVGADLTGRRQALISRFEQVVQPSARACLDVLGNLARHCGVELPH